MFCHQKKGGTNPNPMRHIILMILACLVPIILIGAAYLSGYKGSLIGMVFLLCPLLHILAFIALLFSSKKQKNTPEKQDCH